MDISITQETLSGGNIYSEVIGEADLTTAPKLDELLSGIIRKGCPHLILDLDKVNFIDSSGVGVLIGAFRKLRESNGKFTLICSNEKLLSLFSLTNLRSFVPIVETKEEAVRRLSLA